MVKMGDKQKCQNSTWELQNNTWQYQHRRGSISTAGGVSVQRAEYQYSRGEYQYSRQSISTAGGVSVQQGENQYSRGSISTAWGVSVQLGVSAQQGEYQYSRGSISTAGGVSVQQEEYQYSRGSIRTARGVSVQQEEYQYSWEYQHSRGVPTQQGSYWTIQGGISAQCTDYQQYTYGLMMTFPKIEHHQCLTYLFTLSACCKCWNSVMYISILEMYWQCLQLGVVALGVVAEWSKVLTAVPWPFMVWSTLALGTYQLRFKNLGVSCHLFICIFHFTLHFGLPACL